MRKDFEAKGPMHQAVEALAERVAGGERIALRCWCAPRACHGDHIAGKVALFARALVSAKNIEQKHPELADQPGVVAILAGAEAVSGQQVDATELAELAKQAASAPPAAPAEEAKLKPWQRRGAAALAGRSGAPAAPAAPATPTQRPALQLVQSTLKSDGVGRTVAIIGTAGRDKSKPMTAQLWERMVADAKQRVRPDDTLVSGGAAWADHLAVRLFLDGAVQGLILHLPAPLYTEGFAGPERDSAGSAANYYHSLFKRATGVDGIAEIHEALTKGAKCSNQPVAAGYTAMFARNARVAKDADTVIAYTFGDGDTPADGGTKNTWDQVKGDRIHVPLLRLGALASTPLPASPPKQPGATERTAPPASAVARIDLLGNRARRSRP
jgi:hypothetical protein